MKSKHLAKADFLRQLSIYATELYEMGDFTSTDPDRQLLSAKIEGFAAALDNVRGATPASVLFNDLRTAVSTETAAWGFEQVPEFSPLYRAGHDGGDFILSPVSK